MKIIAFDLDDTLYPESDYYHSGLNAVARAASLITGISSEILYQIMQQPGNPFDNLICHINQLNILGAEITENWCVNKYRTHTPVISLYPDAQIVLQRYNDSQHIPVLITDGRALGQSLKIKALELYRFISPDNIYISEIIGHNKLSDYSFRDIMTKYPGATGYHYIGDNPAKDFYQPNRLGWDSWMLQDRGHNIHNQILDDLPAQYRPNHIITSLLDLNI